MINMLLFSRNGQRWAGRSLVDIPHHSPHHATPHPLPLLLYLSAAQQGRHIPRSVRLTNFILIKVKQTLC